MATPTRCSAGSAAPEKASSPRSATPSSATARSANRSGIESRLHDAVLYNSIYHADDRVLSNTHVCGSPVANASLRHLRRLVGGDKVTMYLDSFARVWDR